MGKYIYYTTTSVYSEWDCVPSSFSTYGDGVKYVRNVWSKPDGYFEFSGDVTTLPRLTFSSDGNTDYAAEQDGLTFGPIQFKSIKFPDTLKEIDDDNFRYQQRNIW